jgi:hypothetical protein
VGFRTFNTIQVGHTESTSKTIQHPQVIDKFNSIELVSMTLQNDDIIEITKLSGTRKQSKNIINTT